VTVFSVYSEWHLRYLCLDSWECGSKDGSGVRVDSKLSQLTQQLRHCCFRIQLIQWEWEGGLKKLVEREVSLIFELVLFVFVKL